MTPENEQAAAGASPICPHCLADPFDVAIHGPSQVGAFSMMAFACANPACRKVFSIQVIGVVQQQPTIVPPGVVPNPLFSR